MNASVRSIIVAQRNASDAISMSQTADGAAEQIHELLTRMRELAVQGANGTNNTTDGANLQTEFASASSEITRIGNVTTYNGTALLTWGPDAPRRSSPRGRSGRARPGRHRRGARSSGRR